MIQFGERTIVKKDLLSFLLFVICYFIFISDVSTKSEGFYVDSSVPSDAYDSCPQLKNAKIWTRKFQPTSGNFLMKVDVFYLK